MRSRREVPPDSGTDTAQPRRFGRRTLFRRAGIIAAAAGGAAITATADPPPAGAAAFDPLLLGEENYSEGANTGLTAQTTIGPTLTLGNFSSYGPLALTRQQDETFLDKQGIEGNLGNVLGDLYYAADSPSLVHTDVNAPLVIGIEPERMLDTRHAQQRIYVVNPEVVTAHGLTGGQWLELDLNWLGAALAAFVNVTAVGPTGPGYVTIAPSPSVGAPATSTVNFAKGVTTANGAMAPLSAEGTLFVYASTTTHVIVDVNGLNTAYEWLTNATPAGVAAQFARQTHVRAAFGARAVERAKSARNGSGAPATP